VVLDRGSFGGADDFDQVSVLCVDPSSPFTGGAILGDRFVCRDTRPTSTSSFARWRRGTPRRTLTGGAGRRSSTRRRNFRLVLVETVGVGQMEVEIASAADTTIVVVNPGWGDAMQANKAGLLEVADIFVINKADRPVSVRRDATWIRCSNSAVPTSGVRRFSRPWPPTAPASRNCGRGREPSIVSLRVGNWRIVVARGCASNSTRCSRRWSRSRVGALAHGDAYEAQIDSLLAADRSLSRGHALLEEA